MRRSVTVAALAVVLAVVPAGAMAGNGEPVNGSSKNPLTLAVIGDTPYGAEQIERFCRATATSTSWTARCPPLPT